VEENDDGEKKLYIMTLGVLKAYRTRGIGKFSISSSRVLFSTNCTGQKLLSSVLEEAYKKDELSDIYLHVHTSNAAAMKFYEKADFKNIETIKNYYKTIDPPDCYKLSRPACKS
jgi:ribosomal protein S18 acetylase RimI-like enzyme